MKSFINVILFSIFALASTVSFAQSIFCEGLTNDENASENVKFQLEIKKDKSPITKDFGPFYKATIKYFFSTGNSYTGADIADKVTSKTNKVTFTGSLPEARNLTFNYNADGSLKESILNYDKKIINQPVQCQGTLVLPQRPVCAGDKDKNKVLLQAIKYSNEISEIENAIDCGAEINKSDKNGCTPIMFAIDPACGENNSVTYSSPFRKTAKLVDTLASNGAFVNVADVKGETPLIKAAKLNTPDIYNTFIALEAEFDAQDKLGNTALMYAVRVGDEWSIEQLLDGNPDRKIKNKAGLTAYDIAKNIGKESVMDLVRIADTAISIEGKEDGTCTPLKIDLKVGQVVDITLKATGKMFKFASQSLGLEIMAESNSSAKRTFSATNRGQFKFTCGFHGANSFSEGTITVQ